MKGKVRARYPINKILLTTAMRPVVEGLEVRRLLSSTGGALDTSFNSTGLVTTDFNAATHPRDQANAVTALANGDIFAVGASGGQFGVALYSANGSVLSTVTTPIGAGSSEATGVVADGNDGAGDPLVLVGGYVNNPTTGNDFVIARYKIVGSGSTQNVVLDTSFGAAATPGYTVTDLSGGQSDVANAIALDGADVLLAGETGSGATEHAAVAAYTASTGLLDPTFASGGVYVASAADVANGLAVAPSGNIALVGQNLHTLHSELTVLNSTATAAQIYPFSFGGTDTLTSIVSADGEYVVAGSADSQLLVAKVTASGTLDNSFGTGGATKTTISGSAFSQANGVAVQSNGKIVLAGYQTGSASDTFVVARYNVNGSTDNGALGAPNGYVTTSFGGTTDVAGGLAIQSDGQIVAAGYTSNGGGGSFDFALARYVYNNAPTASTSPASLNDILQGNASSSGTDVHSLVGRLGASDLDGDALGIAVTGADTTNGTWQYSTNSGGTWTNIPSVSDASALTLADSTSNRLRFVPTSTFTGMASLTLHVWDQTKGSNGTTSSVTANAAENYNSFSQNTYGATITVVQKAATVYVNAAWAGTPDGSPVSDGFGTHTFGIDAFATIQDGANGVAPSGTVEVDAGLYHENVAVSQPEHLMGANAGIAGSSARSAESEIMTSGNQNAVFTVSSNNVTIDGFYIEGSDPAAAGSPLTSGVNSNALYGVRPSAAYSDITVQDNIVKDVFVGFRGDGPTTGSVSGSLITGNWFDSIGFYDFGYAVSLRTNFYADVTDNLMTRVQSGLHTNNFSNNTGPASWLFQGNTVQAYGAGVWDNLQYNGATPLTIDHNNISSLLAPMTAANAPVRSNYDGNSTGILVVSLQGSVGVNITNNSISGMGYGVILYNTPTANAPTIGSTNTIANNSVGVYLTNIVGFNPVTSTVLGGSANNPTGVGKATLDHLTLSGNTTGVLVRGDNPSSTFGVALSLQNGVALSGGTTGLSLTGPLATLNASTVADTTFTGQGGNYIALANTAESGQTITATAATFDGVTVGGGSLTLAQAFAVEDRITDAIDQSGLGFVRIQSGNVFVTPNSFVLPATDDTGAVQRAVNAASLGDTLHVETGLYRGQVQIARSLTVMGQGAGSIIQANAGLTSPFSTSSGAKYPIVFATGGPVTVTNLTIDGNSQGNPYGGGFLGIAFYNSGGTADHLTIENVKNSPFNGVQNGVAVYANNTDGVGRSLNISNNTIFGYQKNGTALFGAGLTLNVSGNTLTGAGSTPLIAQNGIEVGIGASGTISGNTVGGNEYSGTLGGADQFSDTQSCGLLLFSTSGLVVTGNIIDGNDIGIYNNTTNATISGNNLGSGSPNRYEGIVEDQGSSTISGNTIAGGNLGIDIVSFDGNTGPSNATLDGNTVSGASVGLEAIVQPPGSQPASGVDVLAQNNILSGNGEGVAITGGALVDLGEVAPNHDFTPLGTSVGNNTLTGYSGAANHYAIDDENASTQPNVFAQHNDFGPVSASNESAIQAVIHDHGTNPAFSTVIFLPPQNVQPVPMNVYVNSAWAGLPFGTDPDGPGPAIGIGYDAFATIQAGVNAVAPGGTVHIEHNGTATVYDESNILVSQPETIVGDSQAGVIVAPSIADDHTDSSFRVTTGAVSNGFILASSGVTIDDLTIDGNANSALAGIQNYRNAVITNSQNDNKTYNNLVLDHLTVQHIYRKGIALYNLNGVSTGNSVGNSTFNDIGTNGNIAYEGAFAIAAFQSDATISDDTIGGCGGGIAGNSFDGAPGAPKLTVTGNTITAPVLNSPTHGALGMDLASLADGSTVSGNQIDMTGGNVNDLGLVVSFANGQVTIRGNTIGGTAGDDAIMLYQDTLASVPVLVQNNTLGGGSVGSTGTGILLTARASDAGRFGDVAGPVYATVSGNTVNGFGTGIGVISDGLSGDVVNATVGGSAAADSNGIENCGTGVLVSGTGADATITGNNSTLSGNGTAIAAVNSGTASSDHNHIEINSFQWGVGRGISATSGGTVVSRRDSIDMDPSEFAQAIFVDGGNFSGTNDLVNGGGGGAIASNGIALEVTANGSPSVTLHDSEMIGNHKDVMNFNSGVVVDASGNFWGANTEQGVSGLINDAAAGASGPVDYSPWLDNGTNFSTMGGFDGDFSQLDVGSGGAEAQSGGRINEAVGLLTPGGTIQVYPGSYSEDVSLTKGLTLESVWGVTVTDINGDGLADALSVAPGVTGVVVGAPGRGFTINGGSNAAVGLNGTGEVLADNVLRTGGGNAAVVLAGTQEHLTSNVVVSSGSAWAVSITGGTEVLNGNVFQSTGPGNVTVADGSNALSGNTFTAPPITIESGFEQYRDTSAGLDSTGEINTVLANNLFNRGVDHYSSSGTTQNFSKIIWADINPALAVASAGDTIGILGGVYVEDVSVTRNLTFVTSVASSGQTFINGALTIQGVTLRLQSPAATPLLTSSFAFAPTGVLDLANSTLLIGYAGQNDPIATIRTYLANGYNNGGWNGTPTATSGVIISTTAQGNARCTIGYADFADGQGVNTTPNTIELTYTLYGDANLDHQVNSADLQRLLAFFNTSGAWDQGDFNYDGVVNSADLQALLATFNTALGSQATPMAIAATPAAATATPSSRFVPTIQTTGSTDPVVHHLHPAKVAVRKRR
jgi:uncharacterized delta-60 repeat protein